GFSDVYASFPSGHAMNSAAVILLILFPEFIPGLQGKDNILRTIAYGWMIMVGYSRVMMGAHFASDVTVGILLSLLLFEGIRTVVFKVRKEV
ncbi:MAG: phosphatase PAP2 family protein, partial [Dorea sp.]